MKRSYDYSFVQRDDTRDIHTTATRSLRQRSATLATHPFYSAGNYLLNPTANTMSSHMYGDTTYTSAHCLVQDRMLGDGDLDLQSNVWYQQTTTPERSFWRRVSVPLHASPSRPPLAGLGISFEQSEDTNILPRMEYAYIGEPQAQDPIRRRTHSAISAHKRTTDALVEEDIMAIDKPIPVIEDAAYSTCPGAEYGAPSRAEVFNEPSPFCMTYSPADDILMLIDNTPPSVSDELMDLPLSFTMYTPDPCHLRKGCERTMILDTPDLNYEEAMIGIVADVNFRTLAYARHQSPQLCVNPADISGPSGIASPVKIEEDTDADVKMVETPGGVSEHSSANTPARSRYTSPDMDAEFPDEALTAIISVLSASAKKERTKNDTMKTMPSGSGTSGNNRPASALPQHMRNRHYMPQHGFPASTNAQLAYPTRTGFGLGLQLTDSPTGDHGPHPFPLTASSSSTPMHAASPSPVPDPSGRPRAALAPITAPRTSQVPAHRPAPVLNAHEGVELEDLRLRADTFRVLNPGCELDKAFLQVFAGRLSERGELLSEFRCYVRGCAQRNKRRDHILVHVGSHVEHRPFQCPQCGMRFLRKNECKRHMSSHAGFKPFVCTLCAPYQEKCFVRQDLLKRHMKVTHGVKPENWPDRRRRRAKAEEVDSGVEDSPADDGGGFEVENAYMMDLAAE